MLCSSFGVDVLGASAQDPDDLQVGRRFHDRGGHWAELGDDGVELGDVIEDCCWNINGVRACLLDEEIVVLEVFDGVVIPGSYD